MENSAFPSQRSVSSISTSNQGLDAHSSSSTTNNNTEFVNHGKCIFHSLCFHWLSWEYFANSNLSWGYPSLSLILWSKTRQEWIGNRTPQKHTPARESKLSFDASYETLLGTNKPFPQSIPLSEMVDFLVDVWEQEGLYD
uniref:Gag1-like clamp domain-containing protein n=1 Tax=Solanum tuberosum TaxID=4113 RepID=M1BAQ8_SOLTU